MSTEVERLIARLEVQQSQFDRQLRRAQATTNRAARNIENRFKRTNATVTRDFAAMGTRIATVLGGALGFGVGFGAAQLVGGIRSAVSELSALGKEARAASLPVEDLQGLIRGFERNTTVNGAQVSRAFTDFAQRVGEAAQGTGELKRVVDTYGLSLTDANGNLRSQRELLNEVANLIRSAPNDQARTMIANAAFGEPGRQMADALRGGSEALDRMISDARNAGDVIDRNLIQRAELLDDKFDELTRKAGTFFKTLAVGSLGGLAETPLDTLERVFGSIERARAALGDDLFAALTEDLASLDAVAGSVENVGASMQDLVTNGREAQAQLQSLYGSLFSIADPALQGRVASLPVEFRELVDAFEDGEISAQEFGARVNDTTQEAADLIVELQAVDGASLASIISRFQALAGSIIEATRQVQVFKAEAGAATAGPSSLSLREAAIAESGAARDATRAFLAEEERLASRTREQIDLETELGRVQRRAKEDGVALTEAQASAQAQANLAARQAIAAANSPAPAGGSSGGGGGGGGGGGSGGSDFARAVEAIQERTRALEAEAAALVATALSGREYGDAYEFAMQKAKLTYEAQKQGLVVNAELEATINRLAEAYVNAGQAAEAAAQGMKRTADEAQKGAGAISSIFSGILTGATKAEDAVRNLLSQLVSAQFNNLFAGLASTGAGGGFFATIGRALGFADGGYTGAGGKHEPKGIVHAGEYVMSAEAVERMGVRNMERLHRQLRGFRQGGYVGAAASPAIGGGAPIVNVINKTGQPSETRRSTGPDGREVIDVLVGESLSSGRQDKPLGRFGLRPQPVRR